MKLLKATFLILVAALIAACSTAMPGDKVFDQQAGINVYGQISTFSATIDDACTKMHKLYGNANFCLHPENYIWVTAIVGQRSQYFKAGVAIPRNVNPQKGDIILYQSSTETRPWSLFLRVAARNDMPDPNCRWEGSKIFHGGVVCEGWRWDKDLPYFAN